MPLSSRGRFILKTTLIYALCAALWIVLSDQMLVGVTDPQVRLLLDTGKGLGFVMVTAGLLALLLRAVSQGDAGGGADRRGPSRLMVVVGVLAALGIGMVGVLAFQAQSAVVRAHQTKQLQAVAHLEVDAISRWLDERRRIANAIILSPTAYAALSRWTQSGNPADLAQVDGAIDDLRTKFDFTRIEVRALDGGLVLGVGSATLEQADIIEGVAKAAGSRQPILLDLHRDGGRGPLHLVQLVPLTAQGGGTPVAVAVLVAGADDFLFPYLDTWPLPSPTGENELVRRDGDDVLFLTASRRTGAAAMELRVPVSSPQVAAAMAVRAGQEITVQAQDASGVPVLAAAVPVPGTPWVLVAKIDEAEALADIRRLAAVTGVLTLGGLVLAFVFIAYLWQRQQLARVRHGAALGRALAASEAKFRSYVESSPVTLFVVDGDGGYVDCNPAALDLLGYTKEALLALRVPQIHPEEERAQVAADFAELIREGRLERDYRVLRRDGSPVWVHLRAAALPDGHYIGFLQDITGQRAAQAAVLASEERFSTIFHSSPIGIGLGDLQGVLLDVNQAWLDIVGYTRDEAVGRTIGELGVYERPEDRMRAIDMLQAQGRVTDLELPYRRKTGERIVVQYSAEIVTLSDRPLLLVMISDITRRKAEAVALSRFALIVEHLGDPVVFLDRDQRYLTANHAYATLVGMPAADIIGRTFQEVIGPAAYAAAEPHILAALAGETQHYEVDRFFPDGGRRVFDVRLVPFESDGAVQGVVANLHEVTDLRRVQDRLEAAQLMAGMGTWVLDIPSRTYYTTPVVAQDFGVTAPTCSAEFVDTLIHPDDRPARLAAWQEALSSGSYEAEYRMMVNGVAKWVHVKAQVEFDADGLPLRANGMSLDITRRKAEALVLESYREIVENLADPVFFVDRDERYMVANRAYACAIDRRTDDLIGRTAAEVLPPEGYASLGRDLKAALAGEVRCAMVDRIDADGHRHAFDVRVAPLVVDGVVQGAVGNLHDVSELRDIQQFLETAETMAGMGSWVMDIPHGTYKSTYFAFTNLGWEGTTWTEEMVQDLIHPDDLCLRNAAWDAALAGAPYDIEHRFLVRGRTLWVHSKAQVEFDGDGNPVRATGMTLDITARRDAQLALEAYKDHLEDLVAERTVELESAEAKLRLILESSGDGLFGVDTECRITFINRAGSALLGHAADQLLGQNCCDALHLAASAADSCPGTCPIMVTLRTGTGTRCEDQVFMTAQGRPLPVSYSTYPMNQEGVIVGAVVSFADISERKRSEAAREAALAEAERLAHVRREFLANMSHEIRTPLSAVLGLAQVGRHDSGGRKIAEVFRKILDAGQSLLGVVDDVLDFSKIEAGKFMLEHRPLHLGEVIDRALGLVAVRAYAKGLDLRVDEAADLPASCLGDGLRLAQVLGNLLSNAVKFTPAGGVVTLLAGRDADWLVFSVSDSGIGMSPEQMERLFRPFEQADGSTTRHFGGTGLGLAISRNLVEMMGGTVTAASRLGEGSTFTVRVPLAAGGEPLAPAAGEVVVLIGLDDRECAAVAAVLRRHGGRLLVRGADDAVPPAATLVAITAEAAAGPAGRSLVATALATDQRVVVVATPGHDDAAMTLPEGVGVVERPLRARHLLVLPPAAKAAAPQRPRLDGYRILAVEDNEVNRTVLEDLLTVRGARVETAGNGAEALRLLRERGGDAYDLVITDIQMPDMDGYQLAREVAALDGALSVIGLTAHAMAEERDRCLAAGMVEHVAKPFTMDRLVPVIVRHARRNGGEPAPRYIDRERLNAHYGNRPAFIVKLLATVRRTHADTATDLRAAIQNGDLQRLAVLAHSVKGTAGNLAAPALAELAARAETAARAGTADAVALAADLASAVRVLMAELSEEVG